MQQSNSFLQCGIMKNLLVEKGILVTVEAVKKMAII